MPGMRKSGLKPTTETSWEEVSSRNAALCFQFPEPAAPRMVPESAMWPRRTRRGKKGFCAIFGGKDQN